VVAQLDGIGDYDDRLPLDPDYVLACGDRVQVFYLLDMPAKVPEAKPVALALKELVGCDPTTDDLAQGWWVAGNVRRLSDGAQYQSVQVIKPWDGESRTSLADLCVALGLPAPKVPSTGVGVVTNTKPDDDTDEVELEVDPWPKRLDPAAFHGLAGEFVDTIFPHSEADEGALLLQFLTAFGNAIGRDPHALVEDHRHAGNLFIAIVGASGTSRKGTSWGRSYDLYKRADPDWACHCITNGLSTGEGLIHQLRDPIEKRERVKDKGEGDKDNYQTVIVDQGVNDKRVLVVESELGRTFRVMTRDGNTLSAVLRMAWDGADLSTMTKSNPERATKSHISVIGHITADELRRRLDRVDLADGFANRFLFVCARRSKYLPEGGALAKEDRERLVEKLRSALQAARKIGRVQRDGEARELWAAVYPQLSRGRPGLLGAATNRAEAQVLRLSLIYALLDGSKTVRREHLKAACEVWRYAEESARYIFGGSLCDPSADKVLAALRGAGPDGLSKTQIRRDVLKGHGDTQEIQQVLNHLRDIGAASSFEVKTTGRTATRWKALS
jgi:hypothetical protein